MAPTPQTALEQALRLLAARGRTRAELADRLAAKGFSAPECAEALAALERLGYLDDRAVARARATRFLGEDGLAPAAAAAKLRRGGIDEALAEKTVAEVAAASGADPLGAARALLAKRGFGSRPLPPKAWGRAARLLASRGFGEDEVFALLGAPSLATSPEGE